MRRVLVDHCRARAAQKRGGGELRLTLAGIVLADPAPEIDVLAVDRVLTLWRRSTRSRRSVVELRFFAGLTVEETAEAMGISKTTVKREWALARASILVALAAERRPAHDPERWRRVKELFHEALEGPAAEREPLLATAAADDPDAPRPPAPAARGARGDLRPARAAAPSRRRSPRSTASSTPRSKGCASAPTG